MLKLFIGIVVGFMLCFGSLYVLTMPAKETTMSQAEAYAVIQKYAQKHEEMEAERVKAERIKKCEALNREIVEAKSFRSGTKEQRARQAMLAPLEPRECN